MIGVKWQTHKANSQNLHTISLEPGSRKKQYQENLSWRQTLPEFTLSLIHVIIININSTFSHTHTNTNQKHSSFSSEPTKIFLKPHSLTSHNTTNNKMQNLLLSCFFIFFSCAPQQLASSKPFLFHTSKNNRRILHEPFVPLNTLPPSEPPKPPPPLPSPPSTPNTKHPYSTTTTATTPTNNPNENQNQDQNQNQSPFFPNYPPSPPPPSLTAFASFPANISSLVLPHTPQPTSSSNKLLPIALSATAIAAVTVAIFAFVYFRRRLWNRRAAADNKTLRSDSSLELFPRNAETAAAVGGNSSDFLYLGTVVNSRGIGDSPRGSVSETRKLESPELRPLPPLARLPAPPPPRRHADTASEEEDEEFYSPRGSSLGGRESSGGTESCSRRVFSAIAAAGRSGESSSISCSSSSFGSPEQSHSISLSPPASSSPRRTQPKSPESETSPPHNVTTFSLQQPIRNQHVQSSSSSPSFSSSHSERAFDEEEDHNHQTPNTAFNNHQNRALSASTNGHASSSLSLEERFLEKNENAFSQTPARLSNGSVKSIISSSSAFSLPSSPEKMMMHHQGFDQSPRISSVSDGLKLPGLSSLPLSPTLLSSPETERGFNFISTSNYTVPVPQRKHWDIPLSSTPFGEVAAFPDPPPVLQRKHWEIPPLSKPIAPSQPPPPPPLPLQQRQRRHWEMPAPSTTVGQPQPVFRPPELVPPSRPFVLQNHTTNVSSVECLVENEETSKPKLKPLHWDKVRTGSDREMAWDQLKSSSFKLNEEMIETLFVVNTSNQKPKDPASCSVLPPQNQEDRVLDPKKSQNIAILLKALNVTIEEVCEALLEGSANALGTELLESLLKMAPSKEEERKLKEHKDDSPTKLDLAEKFLKAVLDIPFAFKRVEAMLYMTNFESEVVYLRKSFQTLEAACEELRNCRMFLKLLEAVLKTGNRMNVGTNRGDAEAFKLDTLIKLADVKGADGKTSLLHFVVQEIIRTEGARLSGTNQTTSSTLTEDTKCRKLGLQVISSLSSELANVKRAATMDSEVLSSDVFKLSKGITSLSQIVQLNQKTGSGESSQKFTESMNKFIRMAEEEILKIQAQEKVALSLVKEITEYFHGNLAKEEAHPFRIFMVVRDFLAVLDRVCKEVSMINERTMVSSAHKFPVPVNPVPVNPMLPQPPAGLHGSQQCSNSSDDDS